jgi:hypothetical protein
MQTLEETTAVDAVPPNVVSAVFGDEAAAGQAVDALRNLGVEDRALSVLSRHSADAPHPEPATSANTPEATLHPGVAALDGAGIGAAAGALFGLAAAAIPGVGPFVTAGALAQVLGTAAGSAASGAIVGGTSGALGGVIALLGIPDEEARRLAGDVERGGFYVGVDLAQTALDRETVQGVLAQYQSKSG